MSTLTTEQRASINRKNSLHSTGPKSDTGKQRVRFNAVKTGIYSEARLLPGEDPAKYESTANLHFSLYEPQSDVCRELVQELIDAHWRRERLYRAENQVMTTACHEQLAKRDDLDTDGAMGVAWISSQKVIAQIWRALSRTDRQIEKLEKKIVLLKKFGEHSFPNTQTTEAVRKEESPVEATAADSPSDLTGSVPSILNEVDREPLQVEPQVQSTGFVPSNSVAPTAKTTLPQSILRKMPKFSGPNKKKDRQNWMRKQHQKLAKQQAA